MEKNQYKLCFEVLRRFNKAGILDGLILIGSWCLYFYKDYFENISYIDISTIRTRDIDFLVPIPARIKKEADIPNLLKDLGFVIEFKGSKGYIKLDHPDLIVEFLVPEKGRGSDKPYRLPQLGMNATPLRFLSFLTDNV
ncbi:MAG: GSU2403 family nucleotidyltransferase fold protein, partial [Candidatus Omnitrophota bacterium]|nr:GSU2403 family nucleotidyltransferase fold protein [Candidatus Omnitrophota bacterium]